MAQANVAREPSMEEILASIRKIIESNDPAEEPVMESGHPDEPEEQAADGVITTQPVSLLNRISEATAESVGVDRAIPDRRSDQFNPAESLAPLRPTIDQSGAVGQSSEEPEMAKPSVTAKDEDISEGAPQIGSAADVPEVAQGDTDGSDATQIEVVALPMNENNAAPTNTEEPVEEAKPAAQNDPDVSEPRALISPTAGARVAASFGNLNHALSNGPTRSFDEIAEDMLRPMLQQWMDDNLPTLVERLVREEIERVARGRS